MEKTDLVFLFIKEPGKGRASNRIIKLQTALEQISMEGRSPHDTESALSLLKSGQYTSNYLIINPDHPEREEILTEVKTNFPVMSVIYLFNSSDKASLEQAQKIFPSKYELNRAGISQFQMANLFLKIKSDKVQTQTTGNTRSTFIQNLGRGASATVALYYDTVKQRKVAVKQIEVEGMGEVEKEKVNGEVENMKSMNIPTAVELYDYEIENDKRFIYMEYADKGTLDGQITSYKNKGGKFSLESIFEYLIETMLSLYCLNQKGMMHRDIKCENILLKSEQFGDEEHIIAKMSDLGLSRKIEGVAGNLTTCGTPYYVSPEIAAGEKKYNYNSDVWSLGVMLYELVTLNKPWYNPALRTQELFNEIFVTPYPPLPKDTDERIKLLVRTMLTKDPNRRITLEELFKLDFMYEKTTTLLKKFKWDEVPEFKGIFDYEKDVVSHYRFMNIVPKEDIDALVIGAKLAYNCLPFEYKAGFFGGTSKNAIKGDDVLEAYDTLYEDIKDEDEKQKQKEKSITTLLSKQILIPISHSLPNKDIENFVSKYIDSPQNYVFKVSTNSFDSTTGAIDNKPICNCDLTKEIDYLKLSQYLVKIGKKVYNTINKSKDGNVPYEISFSHLYLTFIAGIAYFQECDIIKLPYNESNKTREVFLLNLFQIMKIHSNLNTILNQKKTKSSILGYFQYETGVTYKFKNMTLNDLELKHVVFRANKPVPGSYMRMVYNSDMKCQLLPNYSGLDVLFFLFSDAEVKESGLPEMRFCVFEPLHFEEQFEEFVMNCILANVKLNDDEDSGEKELYISASFKALLSDFGDKDDKQKPKGFIEFVKGYLVKIRGIMNNFPYKPNVDAKEFAALEVLGQEDLADIEVAFF